MGERESGMRREELIEWLEETTRQLRSGTLLVDGEKLEVPEEMKSRIKTKSKKDRTSLGLKLEWEPENRETKRSKKTRDNATPDVPKTHEKPRAMVRDHDSHVLVCTSGDCKKRGANDVRKALKSEIRTSGLLGDVRLDNTGCLGLCKHGPNAVVYDGEQPKGTWYLGLKKGDAPEIVEEHLKGGAPVERLAAQRRPRKAKKTRR